MTSTTNGVLTQKSRVSSIDIMRGIVMVIMALDHTRDFFHIHGVEQNPTNLATTTPFLFFTRIITHYCAPAFVLLSGIAVRISTERKSIKELSLFLLTRGLWLILLEIVVVRFGIFFNLYYDFTFFQVIFTIGASMVLLAGLVFLPARVVLGTGLALIFLHNVFDFFPPLLPGDFGYAPALLLWQGNTNQLLNITPEIRIIVAYPVLPWLGIMATGYGIGEWYMRSFDPDKRYNLLLYSGAAAVLLFLILRSINIYGDPAPWGIQEGKGFTYTLLSFLNVTKYPVSLLYTLMTLGPILIMLALLEIGTPKFFNPFMIYGRVPMFYYIAHFYLIHFLALVLRVIMYNKSWSDFDFHLGSGGLGGVPPATGVALGWVYVVWLSIVVFLYPFCVWYNNYKSTHKHWWLSYV